MTLAGIGPILYPPLINYLLHIYDARGCMLIIGSLSLHMLVAAVLLQPLKWHLVRDTSYILSTKAILNIPISIHKVPTFLSIGNYSDTSCKLLIEKSIFQIYRFYFTIYDFKYLDKRNSNARLPFGSHDLVFEEKHSKFEVDHDIDAQSIYGFDQIVRRQSSQNRLDQETIARNFSKRTLCLTTIPQNVELGLLPSIDRNDISSIGEKPLRWLEYGSKASGFEDNAPITMCTRNDIETKSSSCCCSLVKWFIRFFDLDLLRDKNYLNIMIGMAISIFAETNFAILTPFILSDLNINSDDISMILLVMAIADLISRFCSPFIADQLNLSIRWSYVISLILLVITRMREFQTNSYFFYCSDAF